MIGEDRAHLLLRLLEAVLFASERPLSRREIAARLPSDADVPMLLRSLENLYAGRGVQLVRAGDTWAFATSPDLAPLLARERTVEKKLSRAAIETLAVVAYHQPVTRSEIEEIRGVSLAKGTLDVLFEHGWITPRGRRETPGRPTVWATTDAFLRHFGLGSLADLPGADELRASGLLDARPALQALRRDPDSALPEPLDPDAP